MTMNDVYQIAIIGGIAGGAAFACTTFLLFVITIKILEEWK